MNAAAPAVSRRRASAKSIAWYVTLIMIPVLTAAFLFWLRQAQIERMARRSIGSYGTVPAFEFTNQDGKPFGSAQLQGKIWIAGFIFTNCPGPCPMISSRMSKLQRPLENSDAHLVSFTVDPENDTPEVLKSYSERVGARPGRWDFLTGTEASLYSFIRDGFKLGVSDGAEEMGEPIHTTRVVLVDRKGVIRGYYDILAADAVTKLLADTSHLLRLQPK